MENRKVPALIAVAIVAVALIVFFAVGDDDTSDEAADVPGQSQSADTGPVGDEDKSSESPEQKEPAVPEIEIQDGEPVGGVQEISVVRGEKLAVSITTDAADELHFHGFDIYLDIVPGEENLLEVENADIDGIHELESHSTGALLAEISVVPE